MPSKSNKIETTKTNVVTPVNAASALPSGDVNEAPFDRSFVSVDNLLQLDDDIRKVFNDVMGDWQEQSLSHRQRLQMLGSGVRRYGFNDKVSDFAESNPEFVPPYLSVPKFKTNLRETELLRDISAMLSQMQRIIDDLLLITGDEVYRQALMYYGSVRDASRL